MASAAKAFRDLAGGVVLLAAVVTELSWVQQTPFHPAISVGLIVGGILLMFPASAVARRVLDRAPTPARGARVTLGLHVILMILLGNAVVEAVKTGNAWPGWTLPVPRALSVPLLWITGLAALLAVVNLAIIGLGAPFAPALSQRLATSCMYRWTRNPMGLGTLAFLATLGLWFRSTLFVAWALLLVSPAWLYFVVVYEERELEIRFGEGYRQYRARTPLIIPGRPRRRADGATRGPDGAAKGGRRAAHAGRA